MIKQLLLAPGPTPVPSRVRLAMAQPMFHHRTPQFSALFGEVRTQLQELFQTEQDVLILAASGTGAMEGSVTNLFSPGDEVLVIGRKEPHTPTERTATNEIGNAAATIGNAPERTLGDAKRCETLPASHQSTAPARPLRSSVAW